MIIYLADDLLFPTNSGGRLELLGAARALRDAGESLKVVVVHREQPSVDDVAKTLAEFPGAEFIHRAGLLSATMRHPLEPYQLASRRVNVDVPIAQPVRAIIASHEYMLPVAAELHDKTKAPVILRSHNDEIAYSRSLVTHSRGAKKIYLVAELLRLRRVMSRHLLDMAHAVALISEADRDAYSGFGGPVRCVPPSLATATSIVDAERSEEPVIGFLGALDSSHTERGLAWFVDEVLPRVREGEPQARLVVAGRRASPELERHLRAAAGVDFRGEVSDVGEIYDLSRVFVNPIFDGSGVNMKLGGPAERGLPIVTTSFGVRGLDSLADAAAVADDAEGFAAAVTQLLLSNEEWARRSRAVQKALSTHEPARIAAEFNALIKAAVNAN